MTHKGIWALTVGVVDPGWNCPVSTTLFNFSKVPYAIGKGDVFLRVSLFQHCGVSQLHRGPTVDEYEKGVRKTAMTTFGRQFLNADKVAEDAGKVAMEKMRNSALMWVGLIAFVFTVLQLAVSWVSPAAFDGWHTAAQFRDEIAGLKSQISSLTDRLQAIEAASVSEAPAEGAPPAKDENGVGAVEREPAK